MTVTAAIDLQNTYRALGSTGLTCHCMGFGGYRIANARHEAALREYLDRGGNVVDTSANYGDGLSETLVGKVIKDYDRSKIIVVTKGGYIQGQNMALARQRHFPEVVSYADDLWHCIHPEFLETQIALSLKRLGEDRCEVYLLHNPEYFINHAAHLNPITDEVLGEFYRRIFEAFKFLESQVEKGKIRFYGISSNNFGYHGKDRARTNLARCLEKAKEISHDHHFKVIQLPVNVYESGGAIHETNERKTVLEFAKDNGIGVLVNRPLNAFFQNKLIRLADHVKPGSEKPDLEKIFEPLTDSEKSFSMKFGAELFGPEHEGIGAYLKYVSADIPSREYWPQVMEKYVIPPVSDWLSRSNQAFGGNIEWPEWQENFVTVMNETLDGVEKYLSLGDQAISDLVRKNLYRSGYPESPESLSRIALSLVARLDGVSCVLCGMRSPGYVEDAMGVPGVQPVNALPILEKFQKFINE